MIEYSKLILIKNYSFIKFQFINYYLITYKYLFFYFIICFIFVFILYSLTYLLNYQQIYKEKIYPYECGFEPYEDTRNLFNVQFYLIALLFLIFDLESLYLYPLLTSLINFTSFNYFILFEFFFDLYLTYLYIYWYVLLYI